MATLAKGLAVLGCFGKQRPTMTLSEAALAAGVSRATARRILRTLAELGYVEQHGRQFSLSPNILQLGFAYLATQSWIDRAAPLMKELSERAARILFGRDPAGDRDRLCRAHAGASRIMSVASSVGSRLPAFHTAMGRVQLGFLDEAEIWRRLKSVRIEPYTPSTITDLQALFDRIRDDHAQGFSIVDEELERGLRAIAVPIVDRDGEASPRSISAPIRPARPATRCATVSCRSCAPSPRRSLAFGVKPDRAATAARPGNAAACAGTRASFASSRSHIVHSSIIEQMLREG